MADKIKVTSQKQEMPEKDGPEIPVLDLSNAAVKTLIRSGTKRVEVGVGLPQRACKFSRRNSMKDCSGVAIRRLLG